MELRISKEKISEFYFPVNLILVRIFAVLIILTKTGDFYGLILIIALLTINLLAY